MRVRVDQGADVVVEATTYGGLVWITFDDEDRAPVMLTIRNGEIIGGSARRGRQADRGPRERRYMVVPAEIRDAIRQHSADGHTISQIVDEMRLAGTPVSEGTVKKYRI